MTGAGDELDIPTGWAEAVSAILARPSARVMVIGAVDTGKSSFCRYAASRAAAAGRRTALVDADVGQKMAGPPATVTLAIPAPQTASAPVAAMHFVGSTSSAGHLLPLVIGAARLAAADADIVLINTTGLIDGPGLALKTHKIDAVRPDLLVAIERDRELARVLGANSHLPLLRLAPSSRARAKSPARREANRRAAFSDYFAAAPRQALALDRLAVQRGRAADLVPGLLCGLAGRRGDVLGLGVVATADRARGAVEIITPVNPAEVAVLQIGGMRLDAEWRDMPPGAEATSGPSGPRPS